MIPSNELFSSIIFFCKSSIDRGNVSLPMWILWRYAKAQYLHIRNGYQIPKTELRSIVDRIDIHVEVPRVDYEKLSGDRMGETSESIRKRVQAARNIQQRFASSQSDIICNADMRVGEIRQFCKLQDEGQSLMRAPMTQLNLSARAYILQVRNHLSHRP